MFNLGNLLYVLFISAQDPVETKPSDETIDRASVDPLKNPAILDLYNYHMQPTAMITTFSNPDYKGAPVPPDLSKVALSQALNNDSPTVYPLTLPYIIERFPGYTNDSKDNVRIQNLKCLISSTSKCPSGYAKVSPTNFRLRSQEEIQSLKSNNGKNKKKPEEKSADKPADKAQNENNNDAAGADEDANAPEDGEEE